MSWAAEIVEVHRRPLLRGVSFGVPLVGITAVVDRSMAAGTLLFRMIAGLEPVDHGAVIVLGDDISRARPADRKRVQRRLGVVFPAPEFALFAAATARENVAAFVRTAGRAGRRRERAIVEDALSRLDLTDVADATPNELAPAQRRRLAVARALALQPPLLVADAFDAESEPREIEALSSAVRDDRYHRGSAAVLFMADADLAARVADEVVDIQAITSVPDRSLG